MSFEFCPTCGSLKERHKICKSCSNIIKTPERSVRIQRDATLRCELNNKKIEIKNRNRTRKQLQPKIHAQYSESGGLDYYFAIEPAFRRTRLNFCVKCKQNKLCYAGWWVRTGGKYASNETRKRIFICSDCWKPNKERDEN